MSFELFRRAVGKQIERLQKHDMYRVNVERDAVWGTYLSSFPEGTNPIYRERSVHDCSTCRGFIKNIGNAVAIIDGKIESVWDFEFDDDSEGYATVRTALAALIHSAKIVDVFLHYEKTVGAEKTFEDLMATAQRTGKPLKKGEPSTKEWTHFFANLKPQFVATSDIPAKLAEPRDAHQVLNRGLRELKLEAFDETLDLISQNSLYRGEEHKKTLTAFRKLKVEFDKLNEADREVFVWQQVQKIGGLAKFRNTAIGTLIVDLSDGMDLEAAVKSFETKVAPSNYKRSSALVTPKMIEQAKIKVEELGLTSALVRRYANLSDITVNDILFADRAAKKVLTGNVFDDLAESVTKVNPKLLDRVEEVSIDRFLSEVLPRAKSIEVLLENRHQSNLVSLLAPTDPTAGKLFKWDNHFSWAYHGGIADSDLRKEVKARGGNVEGAFRFSHSWNHDGARNASLMDLHVFMPESNYSTASRRDTHGDVYGNDQRVGWNNRRHSGTGGTQDVDYVDAARPGYVPVENISFPSLARMPEGTYVCRIHNWQFRNPTNGGGKAEIEFAGQVFQYDYPMLKNKEWVTVAEVTLKNGEFTIKHHLKEQSSAKTVWGLQTQQFHKAKLVLLSPNHWHDIQAVGNKHYMFMLDGCVNDEPPRGFFNEFLLESLTPHRKVFEMLGAKLTVSHSDDQLSGLGFSSTQRNSVVLRVGGATTRTIRVII